MPRIVTNEEPLSGKEKMRILVVQETDWIKRGPHQQHHLVDRMALRGHEVRVIDYEFMQKADLLHPAIREREVYSNAHKVFTDADVTLIRPKAIKGAAISTVSIPYFHSKEIRRQIREFLPDIVVAFGILNAYITMQQAQKRKIPFAYYLIDSLHTLLSKWSMRVVAKQVEKLNIRHADNVVVINKGLKDYVVKMGGDPDNISIITAGVDLERFHPSVNGSAIRLAHGIGEDDKLLFFMGYVYEFSGLKEVAEGLRAPGTDNVKLMIVGGGGMYPALRKMSSERELRNKLILVDTVPFDDLPQYIAAADICLLPAHRNEIMENIVPMKMYEYLALGKPVIATSLPGIVKEFGFDSGILYVDKSEDALQTAIEITAEDLRTQGAKARRAVENKDWSSVVEEFERTLYTLVEMHNGKRTRRRPSADMSDH